MNLLWFRTNYEEYFYRIEDHRRAGTMDEFGNCGFASTHIYLYKYGVLKHTKCGTWIDVYGEKRFVLRAARKRFALPTIAEAKESFEYRKARQMAIYQNKIYHIQDALRQLHTIKEDDVLLH